MSTGSSAGNITGTGGRINPKDNYLNSDVYKDTKQETFSRAALDYSNGHNFVEGLANQQKILQPDIGDPNAPKVKGLGIWSMANRWVLFQYKGMLNSNLTLNDYMDDSGSALHSRDYRDLVNNPSANKLINYFNDLGKSAMKYSPEDFIYCRYNGRIPNNYMITVRRFGVPIVDNLFDGTVYDYKSKRVVNTDMFDISRAVTWMSEVTGNKLEEMMSWTVGYNWEEITSDIQTIQSNANGINEGSPILGVGTTGFGLGSAISSIATMGSGVNSPQAQKLEKNAGFDYLKETYPNFELGPWNVINKLTMRKRGLNHSHDLKIKFHYNLAAWGKRNPKLAFLDIIANLLVLTYNTAPFWGGSYRFIGNGNFGSPLGDRKLLEGGDLGGFLRSVVGDIGSIMSNVFGNGKGGFSVDSVLKGLGDVGGDMLGGWLGKNINTPQGAQAIQALLSGEPTGQWHVTIGNPFNPIAMIGNLTLKETAFNLKGPLGYDDFPTELEVTMTLVPGRPRDAAEVETMLNAGRSRLYWPPQDAPDYANVNGKQENKVAPFINPKTGKASVIKEDSKTGVGTTNQGKKNLYKNGTVAGKNAGGAAGIANEFEEDAAATYDWLKRRVGVNDEEGSKAKAEHAAKHVKHG